MHILLAGTTYSDNLGDGVIAESAAAVLKHHNKALKVTFLDIAGRTNYGEVSVRGKGAILKILGILPKPLKAVLGLGLVSLYTLRQTPRWWQQLKQADGLIIGGGQLLQDYALNFPIKLAILALLATLQRRPIGIYAVGVNPNWSLLGGVLLGWVVRQAQKSLGVSVRDETSQAALIQKLHLPPHSLKLGRDPGIAAARAYPLALTQPRSGLGLNLADPRELQHASQAAAHYFAPAYQLKVWAEVLAALLPQGPVKLFTNGAQEDAHWLQEVVAYLPKNLQQHPNFILLPRAKNPTELAQQIGALECLVAHRLHANILGFALNIPSVGLSWDNKVTAFFTLAGLTERLLEPADFTAKNLLQKLKAFRHIPPPAAQRDALITATEAGLKTLCAATHPIAPPVVAS